MSMTLERLAEVIGADFQGEPAQAITGVNSLELAGPGEVTYAEDIKYLAQVEACHAAAVVVPIDFPALEGVNLLRVKKPKIAFVKATEWFYPAPPLAGIHALAFVHNDASVASAVTIPPSPIVR